MTTFYCPECEMQLVMEEAFSMFNNEQSEDVWVCYNKSCKRFDEIVYDKGDLE